MKILIAAILFFLVSCASVQHLPEDVVFRSLADSVFKVSDATGMGTAFVVNTINGPIAISAGHVCINSADGTMIASKFNTISNKMIHVLKIDADHDLCALESPGLPGLDIQDGPIEQYQSLYSMGYPLNTSLTPRSGHLVAAMTDPMSFLNPNAGKVEETTILAFPGQSGSPVVTDENKLIGVITMTNNDYLKSYMRTRTEIRAFIASLTE